MNNREESFKQKFSVAAQQLSVRPEQVVSLKLRENVNSYREYRELLEALQREAGLRCSEIKAQLQGRSYMLGDGKTNLIMVEHETGLELLYIAGSIASILALVPMILQGWRALRGRFWGRNTILEESIEIRRIDNTGHLHEEHLHDRHVGVFMPISSFLPAISETSDLIEVEIKALTEQVQLLGSRIDALEKLTHITGKSTGYKETKSTDSKTAEHRIKKNKRFED